MNTVNSFLEGQKHRHLLQVQFLVLVNSKTWCLQLLSHQFVNLAVLPMSS